jgi:hypothetical protein
MANSEKFRSRMVACCTGKNRYGDNGRWVKYWARLGGWISPFYGFETYEPLISLIFKFFWGRGKPRITDSVYMEAHPVFEEATPKPTRRRQSWILEKGKHVEQRIEGYSEEPAAGREGVSTWPDIILKMEMEFRIYLWRTKAEGNTCVCFHNSDGSEI